MNREQYLAKRMRLCGMPPDAGAAAGLSDARGDAAAPLAPAFSQPVSLVEHYRSLHSGSTRTLARSQPN